MSITDELERVIGTGPLPPRPVEDTLAAGHRALRRRRAATATAGLAAVAVLGVTWAAVVPGDTGQRRGDDQVASDTTQSPEEEAVLGKDQLAAIGPDGLVVREGVTVLRRVENPMGFTAPDQSLGLVLEYRGETIWWLGDRQESSTGEASSGTTYATAGHTFPTFDLWLADAVATQKGEPTLALVRFAGDGTLVADEDDVQVVDQRARPAMPRSFAGPDEETAVAEVTWQGDTWFVLARRLPGYDPEYFPTAASIVGDADTIDEFLVVARERYDNGDGLR